MNGYTFCSEFLHTYRQTILSLILSGNSKVFTKISTIIRMMWTDNNVTYIPDKPLCEIDEIMTMLRSTTDDFRMMDNTVMDIYLPIMKQLVEKGNEMKTEQVVPLAKLGAFVGEEWG